MKGIIQWLRSLGVYFMLGSAGYCLWYFSGAEEFYMWLFLIGAGLFYLSERLKD